MSLKAVAVLTGEVVRGVVNFEQEVTENNVSVLDYNFIIFVYFQGSRFSGSSSWWN